MAKVAQVYKGTCSLSVYTRYIRRLVGSDGERQWFESTQIQFFSGVESAFFSLLVMPLMGGDRATKKVNTMPMNLQRGIQILVDHDLIFAFSYCTFMSAWFLSLLLFGYLELSCHAILSPGDKSLRATCSLRNLNCAPRAENRHDAEASVKENHGIRD